MVQCPCSRQGNNDGEIRSAGAGVCHKGDVSMRLGDSWLVLRIENPCANILVYFPDGTGQKYSA